MAIQATGLALSLMFLPSINAAAAFLQNVSGVVSIDAESYTNKTSRSGHDWVAQTNPPAGFAGNGVMQSTPDNGAKWTTNYAAGSPQLDFDVEFNRTGTHFIWVRGASPNWGGDSLHIGLDGQQVASAAAIVVPAFSGYAWGGGLHAINVTSTGVHTINVWIREDGVNIDKLVLASDSGFTPTGTGPAESQQTGAAAVATPTISPNGGTFTDSTTVTLASATEGAVIYYTLDGSEPTTSSILYSSPLQLTNTATIKAKGFLGGFSPSASSSATFTRNAASSGDGVFQQNGSGVVAIDAENYANKTSQSGHDWVVQTNPASGFAGSGVMQSTPNNGAKWTSNYAALSPRLDYEVEFNRTGTHYIWVRGASPDWGADSLHVGFDGQQVASAAAIVVPAFSGYVWGGGIQTIIVPSTGTHTINVWVREDGVNIDKLVLASAAGFTPSGTGPAESQQSGTATVASPTISPDGGSFTASTTVSLASATAGAVIHYTLDGSEPNTASAVYGSPFVLSSSATVKAKAYLSGANASATVSATFITIGSTNEAPVLNNIGNKAVEENQPLGFTVRATDSGASPILSASGLPSGASFSPATGVFSWSPASGAAANSPYAITFVASDASDTNLTDSETISITVTAPIVVGGNGAFQQNGAGMISVEAESYSANISRSGHDWIEQANPAAGYSGSAVLQSTPDSGAKWTTNYASVSPQLDFEVEFNRTGTHYVWVRGVSPNWGSDSIHIGLDGQAVASAASMSVPAFSGYRWGGGVQTINVPSTGVHTINIWLREDGIAVDKLVLTSDANFSPNGVGPAESVQGSGCTSFPSVKITSLQSGQLQTSGNIVVDTLTCLDASLHSGWGVKLTIDGGSGNGGSEETRFAAPFSTTFSNVAKAEHSVSAYIVNASGNVVAGAATQDSVNPVGIGDYYVAIGDSITVGVGDDIAGDNTSMDNRNSGGGYTPILNNLLTEALGYPHTIVAAGIEGVNSAGGLAALPAVLSANANAQRYLVKYGMNDARPFMPVPSGLGLGPGQTGYPGSFKDNMQRIINAINSAGKEAVLAKVNIALADGAFSTNLYPNPDQGARSVLIQEFNQVIDELRAIPANNISIAAPDFYDYFRSNYAAEYADNIHPNGDGYQAMANIWLQVITGF